MSQRGLNNVTRVIGRLCRPILEARPAPMWHEARAQAAHQLYQGHIGQRLAGTRARKEVLTCCKAREALKNCNAAVRQWNAMHAAAFHPIAWHGPNSRC